MRVKRTTVTRLSGKKTTRSKLVPGTARLSPPVKKAIKKLVTGMNEKKYVALTPNAAVPGTALSFTQAITSSAVCYPLLPPISQGLTAESRIGDRIRPTALRVHFTISVSPAGSTLSSSNDMLARLFILEDRSLKGLNYLNQTPIATELLDVGNGSFSGFTGLPNEVNYRLNSNRYKRIKDKTMRVSNGNGQLPGSYNVVPYVGTQTCIAPGQIHQFTVRIPCPKVLKYETEAAVWPSNFAPFFCLGYITPQHDGVDAVLDNRVFVNYTSQFDFTDS